MDGRQGPVRDSLQRHLSLRLSAAILIVALLGGVFAFLSAFDEAYEFQDDALRQVATLFDHPLLAIAQTGAAHEAPDIDPESRFFIRILAPVPAPAPGAESRPALPDTLPEGIQTVRTGGETYRVLVRTLASGQRLAVAQDTDVRDEIALHSALRTLAPLLLLVPILLLVVSNLVRTIFKPVVDLSVEIDRRREQELQPIDTERLPAEIWPFVRAINRLLRRVDKAMAQQRRFVADAAHELRTPLTALSLQAERLAQAEMPRDARERLATLRQGIDRGNALLEQLLAFARAQVSTNAPLAAVSVQQVFRRALEDLMPLAEQKGIDIGLAGGADARVVADEFDLVILVKNLLANAIRYTPRSGRIDLSVSSTAGATRVVIEDSGPGIPEAERERVFEPFYRILGQDEVGSGLGLAIVQSIAARIGAHVHLGAAGDPPRPGLRVEVTFPAAPRGSADA